MKQPNPTYYYQDDEGTWWRNMPNGTRTRAIHYTCKACGEEFVASQRKRTYCSRECAAKHTAKSDAAWLKGRTGERNGRWKGGRYTDPRTGYVFVRVDERKRTGARKYRPEHRLVMEEKIGRPLLPTERVHHINGIRSDNDPENLELWATTGHPIGQRKGEGAPHCPTCTCFDCD